MLALLSIITTCQRRLWLRLAHVAYHVAWIAPFFLTSCERAPISPRPTTVLEDLDRYQVGQPATIAVFANDDPGTYVLRETLVDENGNSQFLYREVPFNWVSVQVKVPPSHGSAVVNGLTIVYTNDGQSDSDSFTYTAFNENGEAGSATVHLNRLEAGENFARADGPLSASPGGGLLIDVLKNDLGSNLEILSVTTPRFGTVTIDPNPDGRFPPIPKLQYSRGSLGQYADVTDEFTYTITGGTSATVSVVVKGFGNCEFVNQSQTASVQFKVGAALVTDATFRASPLALRPQSGSLGAFFQQSAGSEVTIVAETIPSIAGTPVQWTGPLGPDDRVQFNDQPTPILTVRNRFGF